MFPVHVGYEAAILLYRFTVKCWKLWVSLVIISVYTSNAENMKRYEYFILIIYKQDTRNLVDMMRYIIKKCSCHYNTTYIQHFPVKYRDWFIIR
jgi:hypothetical protein